MANKKESGKWETLRWATVIGIVDSYDAVHSRLLLLGSRGDKSHTAIFGTKGQCAWRWTFNDCITWITPEMKPSLEQYDAIQHHLSKRYGLKWRENGYHDVDYFLEKLYKERDLNKQKQDNG